MQAILNLTKEMTWCEFAGSIFGLLGAFLVAMQTPGSEFGFVLVMQVCFTATSLMGIYNGFIV